MNYQKICIIGDGLAGLTTAIILSKENVKIDLYSNNKKKKKSQTIGQQLFQKVIINTLRIT